MPGSIGVHDTPDGGMPIGIASGKGHGERGLAVWSLRIGERELPGQYIIADREFVPIDEKRPGGGRGASSPVTALR